MTEKCVTINRTDIEIIGKSLEEYWALDIRDKDTIININHTRQRIKNIKEKMGKLNELKICWS